MFVGQLREGYTPYRSLSEEELSKVLFATKPGPGAGVYVLGDMSEVQ